MQSYSDLLFNGSPVSGGQILNGTFNIRQAATVPSTEKRQTFTSTSLLHPAVFASTSAVNNNFSNVQRQAPVQKKQSSSMMQNNAFLKVNVNAAKPKHKRLNDFNVIRRANTVVCGPNGPILDPRVQLSHDLPHKKWPYSSRSKPRGLSNQEEELLYFPSNLRVPKASDSQSLIGKFIYNLILVQ